MTARDDKRDEGVAALNALAEIADAMDLPLAESVSVEQLKGHILKAVTIPSHEQRIHEGRRSPPAGALVSGSLHPAARDANPGSAVPGGVDDNGPSELDIDPETHPAYAPSTTPQKPIAWRYRYSGLESWRYVEREGDCNPYREYEKQALYAAPSAASAIRRSGDRRVGPETRRSGADRRVTPPKEGDPTRRMLNRRGVNTGFRRADGGKQTDG